jgi:hypothetical protein
MMCVISSCSSDKHNQTIFTSLDPNETGISFQNTLTETNDFNILTYLYYYNGGGVAIGDINNDGLEDIFFTANQGSDKLYLNKGNLTFEDITESSGISTDEGWSTGVTLADINLDGWLDIYVCRLGSYLHINDHNRLYINNKDGSFKEESREYGLAYKGFSTQAAFFDYDRDGDLDCYLLNHSTKSPEQFADASRTRYEQDSLSGDRLLRNDQGYFHDVSAASGIFSSDVGFGLGLAISDFNNDGWVDIYIGNDFHENDYLYLNQTDGTFSEVISSATGHTSNFTMGVDVGDLNNDGLIDIFSLDMQPMDELTYKNSGGWESYEIYQFKRGYKYHHQSPKNALQLNAGIVDQVPIYQEVSGSYGALATDWSWSPLIEDYDMDGDMDIFVANGIVRRPNDLDFTNFYANEITDDSLNLLSLLDKMPKGAVPNVFLENNGDDRKFSRLSVGEPSVSTGAAYGDLDNDGDLDIVINNISAPATLLRNDIVPQHSFSFRLSPNEAFAGTSLTIYIVGQAQHKSIKPVSGFQSASSQQLIFGSSTQLIDSLKVRWSDGSFQKLVNLSAGVHEIKKGSTYLQKSNFPAISNFERAGNFVHLDIPYNDQSSDFLLPVFASTLGPKVEIRDDFIYLSGGKGQDGIISINENIIQKSNKGLQRNYVDELGAAFFDLEGDGDLDLYICTGGNEVLEIDPFLKDVLLVNDNGQFQLASDLLPDIYLNTSVVKAADFDMDGDEDLFIGVSGKTSAYGLSFPSYLLVNDNGRMLRAPLDIEGMVYDAEWVDLENDGDKDLVLAGPWMPITIFLNDKGRLGKYEIPDSEGWWLDIEISDVNNDGKPDIIGGNFGHNHRLQVDQKNPLKLYIADFDDNGKSDPIITYREGGKEYIYPNLEMILKQLPGKKKQFVLNKNFSGKSISEIFTPEEIDKAQIKTISTISSQVFFQSGPTDWRSEQLPFALQTFPIFAIEKTRAGSYVFGGNLNEVDPNLGRQDAGFLYQYSYDDTWGPGNILTYHRGQVRDIQVVEDKLMVAYHNDSLRWISDIPMQIKK